MRSIKFSKSSKAVVNFGWEEFENSLYDCAQEFIKGFVSIDGKTYSAIAEVYPSCYANGKSFIRSIQMKDLTIKFSESGNAFAGPLWLFETTGVDYRS